MNLQSTPSSNEEKLLDQMTTPRDVLVEAMAQLRSPLLILGAGGKMGPSLAVLARRAAQEAKRKLDVIAVSRFNDASAAHWLEQHGVQTISVDLLERGSYSRLPDAAEVVYLVGMKFGTSKDPSATWAANTVIPALAAERYPHARWSILSTGNVYPLVEVASGGAKEDAPLTPLGEYPNAAVARERVFGFFSQRQQTPMTVLRLSYAIDLRYGVLVDLALKIWNREPIDLTTGFFNCIWQGDANEVVIRALTEASTPPLTLNLTGIGPIAVRTAALKLSERLGRQPTFVGQESPTALLSDTAMLQRRFGPPATSFDLMVEWVADWVKSGGRTYNRPTHFEVRDGSY